MHPNHEPVQTSERTQLQPEYADLLQAETHMAQLESELDGAIDTFGLTLARHGEQAGSDYERTTNQYYEDQDGGASDGAPAAALSDYLRQRGVAGPIVSALEGVENTENKIAAATAAREAFAPEKAAIVLEKAKELEDSIDYDKVVLTMYAPESSTAEEYGVSNVIGVRKLLEAGHEFGFDQLLVMEAQLEEKAIRWKEQDLLLDSGAIQPGIVEPTELTVPDTAEETAELKERWREAVAIASKYRPVANLYRQENDILMALDQVQNAVSDPTVDDVLYGRSFILNDNFKQALQRPIARAIAELPTLDYELDLESEAYRRAVEAACAIDIDKALQAIEISGLEDLPFPYSEARLKQVLAGKVPGIALDYVKKLEFRPLTPGEDPEGNTDGFHDEGTVVINADALKEYEVYYLKEYQDNERLVHIAMGLRMEDIIVHEFGHALHAVLPVAALKQWEEATVADQVHVTAYVGKIHDAGKESYRKEDFADSIALFAKMPAELRAVSAPRYKAMRRIHEQFMPGYNAGWLDGSPITRVEIDGKTHEIPKIAGFQADTEFIDE